MKKRGYLPRLSASQMRVLRELYKEDSEWIADATRVSLRRRGLLETFQTQSPEGWAKNKIRLTELGRQFIKNYL